MSVSMQPGSPDRENAEYLAEFLDRYYSDEIAQIALGNKGSNSLHVDIVDLQIFLDSDGYETLLDNADHYRRLLEEAITFADSARGALDTLNVTLVDSVGADINHLRVSHINSNNVGDYLGVQGQLSAVTEIKSFPRIAAFSCNKCGWSVEVPQDTKEFTEPSGTCECERAPEWKLDYQNTEWVDHRKLKIQEPPDEAANGETQYVVAHMFADDTTDEYGVPLTERVGEDVTVYGTVELRQEQGRNKSEYLFNHYLSGQGITFEESGLKAVDVDSHLDEIEAHANADGVYERFYRSLAPQIHPTDQMELAMKVCAAYLFAAPRVDPEEGAMYRGDIHAAIIGDPGLAKSVLLKGVAEFSPDAEHRSATGLSSDVGLVAAAVEDEFDDGGWMLKPGILVRAGMHAVIDEIDKGPDDLEKINDAMEGRQIATVDKAGMKADLKTRTGLLTSGNPEGSRFDKEIPLPEQVDIDQSLLTRFDAIVLLTDVVDKVQDRKVGEHITESFRESVDMMKHDDVEPDVTKRVVSAEVGRAWVAAGREIVPQLSDSAAERLTDFYVEVRTHNDDPDTISATARQLEGGIRFAMAFARMRLSETVDPQDVDMAIDVSKALIGQTHDGQGNFDIDRLTVETKEHTPDTQDAKKKAIKGAANHSSIAEIAAETDIEPDRVEKEVQKLKKNGELYEPKQGEFKDT